MLENVDLGVKLTKADYKKAMAKLELELGELQRTAREVGLPVLVVFEGWEAAGKGTLINKLIHAMDPRGYTVQLVGPPTEDERLRPYLWRFWNRTPEGGRITLFDRSWYRRVLIERVDRMVSRTQWARAYQDINAFERQLTDGGAVLVKFLLHIDKDEQRKRLKKLDEDKATSWRVTKDDWRHHKLYERHLAAFEEMLERTDTALAPWSVIASHDQRHAAVRAFQVLTEAIRRGVKAAKAPKPKAKPAIRRKPTASKAGHTVTLDRVDLSADIESERYQRELKKTQKKLGELGFRIYSARLPVVVAYEGWDAAGKGGNIRRVTEPMDPRAYDVIPVAAPNDIEKRHHYLWRFWQHMPKDGHIAIFDRSWYGRVLVERVEGFCREQEWRRAYREINEMEEHMAAHGAVIAKFWLHISPEEQLRRFKERQRLAHKKWKITDEDWRNRDKWDLYREAVEEMLLRTSTTYAPWTIVEADSKRHARIKVMQTLVQAIEARLK
ncbi:MAG: phosphate--AMP phosphotransferase [Pseudomonadota bacterium]